MLNSSREGKGEIEIAEIRSHTRKRVRQCQVMNKSRFAGKSFVTSQPIQSFDIDNDDPY